MRKILAVGFLVAVAVALWYGGRWFVTERALEATLVFDRNVRLSNGDPVLHDGLTIGAVENVSKLRTGKAVEIRIDREHRHLIRTDSSFIPSAGEHSLIVSSSLAVGPPLADGAVVHVRESQIAGWLARGAEALQPLKKKAAESRDQLFRYYDEANFERKLAGWAEKIPEWKEQGSDVYERNLAYVRAQAAEAEAQLREASKNVEADRLRARFDAWLESVGK